MSKIYTLITEDEDTEDDQKTVQISEDVTETHKDKTSIAQLKEKYKEKVERIKSLGKEVDEIVDELKAIDENISEITVDSIPSKVIDDTKDKPEIPPKK